MDETTWEAIDAEADKLWREWERGSRPAENCRENSLHYWTGVAAYQRGLEAGRKEAAEVVIDLDCIPDLMADSDPYWKGFKAGDTYLRRAIRALSASKTEE